MKYFRKRNYSKYKGRKRLLVRLLSLMLSFFMFAEIMLSGLSGVLAADTPPANPEEKAFMVMTVKTILQLKQHLLMMTTET